MSSKCILIYECLDTTEQDKSFFQHAIFVVISELIWLVILCIQHHVFVNVFVHSKILVHVNVHDYESEK